MKRTCCLIFLLALAVFARAQSSTEALLKTAAAQPGFLENRGQIKDFDGRTVDDLYYAANLGGQQVFITKRGLSFLFSRIKQVNRVAGAENAKLKRPKPSPADSLDQISYEMERVDLVLQGGAISKEQVVTKDVLSSPVYHLYLHDKDTAGATVRLKKEILIRDVYPGIDWKIYIKTEEGRAPVLKHDFIVHPGADPLQIALRYSGNAKLEIAEGMLHAKTKMAAITEDKPYSFLQENKKPVTVHYRVEKNTVRYAVADYPKDQALVIDPSIFWLTYLTADQVGTYYSLYGHDIETDTAGNIFVQFSASGNASFPTVNPGGGAYFQDHRASPNGSMVITKFSPGGQMLWSTYFGNWVGGRLMTVDRAGNIVALGRTLLSTPTFPFPKPQFPLVNSGGFYQATEKTYFITKFSNEGKLLWSSWYLHFESYPMDMSYDVNGNVYVTGWSTAYDFPIVDPGGGAYMLPNAQSGSRQVLFMAQFNAADRLTWSTRIEGNDYDPYARVCTDPKGNIYLGGQTRSGNYPLLDAGGYYNDSRWGSVVTRFNAARQMTWSTYVPGPFALADLTADDSSNLYVVVDSRILKFDAKTNLVFETRVATAQHHWWEKIQYDRATDQIQLLGVMNDGYFGFPTVNTACNGSFFHDGLPPRKFTNGSGPIFATIDHAGNFSYRSLVDWVYEYYDESEMAIDAKGNMLYLFGSNRNGHVGPNPQLTNPGNGAYFDTQCCYLSTGTSSLLLKLLPSDLSVKTTMTPATGCNCDGTASAVAQCGQAPFTYQWSTGATTATVTGLCAGEYWVKVTDAKNLSQTVKVIIPRPAGSMTSLSTLVAAENCNKANGTLTVQAVQGGTAPYTYSMDGTTYGTTSSFAGLDSGEHMLWVKDANGCSFKDTVLVGRVKGPTGVTTTIQNSSCSSTDGQLRVSGVQGGVAPYSYSLSAVSSTNGLFTSLAAGSYSLVVTDAAGCAFTKDVVVGKASPPTAVSAVAGADHCEQGIGYLTGFSVSGGPGPYTYSVDSASFFTDSIRRLSAGSYPLFVKDANGCVLKKEGVVIGEESGPRALQLSVDHAYCGRLTGKVKVDAVQGGSGSYTYALDGGTFGAAAVFSNLQPGAHRVAVKDAFGCFFEKAFVVDYVSLPQVRLTPADTTICYDESVQLQLSGEVNRLQSVSWNVPTQGGLALLKATASKTVYVTMQDSNGCVISDTSYVRIKACSAPENCLVVPTAFTPNGDGKNESAGAYTNGCRVTALLFQVYNRWGERVYETRVPGTGWDGNYRAVAQPADTYVYVCEYVTEDGVKRVQKGTISLIR